MFKFSISVMFKRYIGVEKEIFTIEDCNKKCEESADCAYYTLYKNDFNKNCKIVS